MGDTGGKTAVERSQQERSSSRSGQRSQTSQMRIGDTGRNLCIHCSEAFQQSRHHLRPQAPVVTPDYHQTTEIDACLVSSQRRKPATHVDGGYRGALR